MKSRVLLKFFPGLIAGLLFTSSVQAQVQVDKPIQMSGSSGANRQIKGVGTPTATDQAVNAGNVLSNELTYADGTLSGSVYSVNLPIAPSGYTIGMKVNFKANLANPSPVSINVNGQGNKTIKKDVISDLAVNDIVANQLVTVIYDGTNFQLVSRIADKVGTGTVTSVTAGTGLSGGTITGSGTIDLATPVAVGNGGTGVASLSNVTAGSTKVSIGGTPTGAVIKPFSVDVNEGNLTLNNIGGTLGTGKGGTGVTALSNVTAGSSKITLGGTPTASVIQPFSIDVSEANLTHNNIGGILGTAKGGTGLNTSGATNGQLLIGNGSGLTLANLTAGTGINISNSSGGITINNTVAATTPGGSNTQVQYNNSGAFAGSSNFVWDNTNARVGIGTASPTQTLEVQGGNVMLWRFAANSNYIVRRSNGSAGAETYLANNDALGYLNWQTYQSSGVWLNVGRIGVESEGTHSSGSLPTRLVLGTTPVNSPTMLERARIDNQGIFTLNNNNTLSYPGYNGNGGGAISWNFSGGNGEVDIWNNVSAGNPRGFSFRQMTSASASTELLRVQGDGGIFGKFRSVTYHNFNIPSGGYTANSGYAWFPSSGGEASNDNITTVSQIGNYQQSSLMPYAGRVVAVIIRVDYDSNPNEEIKGRIAVDVNGSITTSSVGVNLNQGGQGTYTLPTTGYSFSRGDRVAIGVNLVNNAACNSGTCWVEDNNFWVTVIWEYNMQD